MAWRVFSVSTSNWTSKVQLTPSASSWKRTLNAGAGGSSSFPIWDPDVAETATPTNLAPWSRMIVMDYYGVIVYAGFITGTDYDKDSGLVTVTHEDVWSLLKKRVMCDILSDGVQARPPLTYTGVGLSMLVKQAIYQGQNDAARFNLPIALPADSSGSLNKTFDAWGLPDTATVVQDQMNTEGGPDVDLLPQWYGNGLFQWNLRVGTLNSGTWSWDVSTRLSQVSGLKVKSDGSGMANRVAAVGEGSEKKMLLSVADGSASSSFLPLDAVTSYKTEKDPVALAARARADLATKSKPTEQVSMDVLMDADFSVDMLQLGGTVNWRVQGDPYLVDGWRSSRLIEYSGDLSSKVHLEFQTVGG